MTFLLPINIIAARSADLDGELLTCSVRQELVLALCRLDVLGAAGRFINRPALFRSLSSADLRTRQ